MRTYESGTPCHKHPTVAEHLFALTLVECYIRSITDRIRICNVRHLEYDKVHVTSLGVRKQAGHIARLCEICLPHGARPGLRLPLTTLPFGAWRYRNRSSTSRTIDSATTLALLITLGGSNASRAQALSVPGNNTRPIVGTSGLQ